MDTPVPMPNTEVKHRSGDDSRKRQKQHAASLSGPQGDSFFLSFFLKKLVASFFILFIAISLKIKF